MDPNKLKELGKRIHAVRTVTAMNQHAFAKELRISASYLSLLEHGAREPSGTLLELLIYKFGLNRDWLYEGRGKSFAAKESPAVPGEDLGTKNKGVNLKNRRKNFARDALVAAAMMGPVMPYLSGTIAIGIGAANILGKLCMAYKVKNIAQLAEHLQVNRTTVDYWLKKDEVPKHIIKKALDETAVTVDEIASCGGYFIINKNDFAKLLKEFHRQADGRELSDTEVDTLIKKAMTTKEEGK